MQWRRVQHNFANVLQVSLQFGAQFFLCQLGVGGNAGGHVAGDNNKSARPNPIDAIREPIVVLLHIVNIGICKLSFSLLHIVNIGIYKL